jgi:hypothetical protein
VVDALRPDAERIARCIADHLPWLITNEHAATVSGLRLLRQLGPAAEEALPVLWDRLGVRHDEVRWELARSIIAISPDHSGVLSRAQLTLFEEYDPAIKVGAVTILGLLGKPVRLAVPQILRFFRSTRRSLAAAYAAWALGEIDPKNPEVQSVLAEVRANWPDLMRQVEELASSDQ